MNLRNIHSRFSAPCRVNFWFPCYYTYVLYYVSNCYQWKLNWMIMQIKSMMILRYFPQLSAKVNSTKFSQIFLQSLRNKDKGKIHTLRKKSLILKAFFFLLWMFLMKSVNRIYRPTKNWLLWSKKWTNRRGVKS